MSTPRLRLTVLRCHEVLRSSTKLVKTSRNSFEYKFKSILVKVLISRCLGRFSGMKCMLDFYMEEYSHRTEKLKILSLDVSSLVDLLKL